MNTLPWRLRPGDDLRRALEAVVAGRGLEAAFVLCGIGSLGVTRLRLAGAPAPTELAGDVEILTLAGSVGAAQSHLHASVSDAQGHVLGGHLAYGCMVRTTAEVLLAVLPEWRFTREPDPATGFEELTVKPRAGAAP